MGNITTHPNLLTHPDVIELYQEMDKSDADKIYNAMDKTDYRNPKLGWYDRYLDLARLKKGVKNFKRENPTAKLVSIKLTLIQEKYPPYNCYESEWKVFDCHKPTIVDL